MHSVIQDAKTLAPSVATAGVGFGLTLTDVQSIIGIAAGLIGIIATLYTLWMRRREHKRAMSEPQPSNRR